MSVFLVRRSGLDCRSRLSREKSLSSEGCGAAGLLRRRYHGEGAVGRVAIHYRDQLAVG
jgi:hypothetical protein